MRLWRSFKENMAWWPVGFAHLLLQDHSWRLMAFQVISDKHWIKGGSALQVWVLLSMNNTYTQVNLFILCSWSWNRNHFLWNEAQNCPLFISWWNTSRCVFLLHIKNHISSHPSQVLASVPCKNNLVMYLWFFVEIYNKRCFIRNCSVFNIYTPMGITVTS